MCDRRIHILSYYTEKLCEAQWLKSHVQYDIETSAHIACFDLNREHCIVLHSTVPVYVEPMWISIIKSIALISSGFSLV